MYHPFHFKRIVRIPITPLSTRFCILIFHNTGHPKNWHAAQVSYSTPLVNRSQLLQKYFFWINWPDLGMGVWFQTNVSINILSCMCNIHSVLQLWPYQNSKNDSTFQNLVFTLMPTSDHEYGRLPWKTRYLVLCEKSGKLVWHKIWTFFPDLFVLVSCFSFWNYLHSYSKFYRVFQKTAQKKRHVPPTIWKIIESHLK